MQDDIDEVRNIISQSGNNFHCQVIKFLKSLGWRILISPYYNDNQTNKPREIDLIAEKSFPINNFWGQMAGEINVRLFVECKYIPQKTVFWFHEKDIEKAENLAIRSFGLRKDNSYTSQHHFLSHSNSVAKLFSDGKSKQADNETFFKALNQSLNAMVYFRFRNSIIPIKERRNVLKTICYPIICCNSYENLYKVDISAEKLDPEKIPNFFQLEVNYAYCDIEGRDSQEFFLIDIVALDNFSKLLNSIEEDVKIVGHFAIDNES